MAAKKREGEGSNMGLIVTLVFFVLATVILGVTTYLGFADQAVNEKKAKDAESKASLMEKERNWHRFKSNVLREYIGARAAGIDVPVMVGDKNSFDKGQLNFAGDDKAEFKALLDKFDAVMKWEAGKDAPNKTFESRLEDLKRQIAGLNLAVNQLKKEKETADQQAKEDRAALEEERKNFKAALAKLDEKASKDRDSDRATIDTLRKDLAEVSAAKEKVNIGWEETKKKLATTETLAKRLGNEVKTTKDSNKDLRDQLDDTKTKLSTIAEKTGVDLKAAEAEALDARALQMLKVWNKPWRVVELDRRGDMPYINLGSNDGLTQEVTFSVHGVGTDGKMVERPKGTVEVVRVIGPHLAQARVTSMKDRGANPILKGDKLFNPTWDPSRKRHIAIAGIADLGGDGTDNTEDFRRLMQRQNVVLDAYIDTKDEKAPKLVGKGVGVNTDYLILADTLESVRHPRSLDKGYVQAFDRMREDLKQKAISNGVTVITLRRYLDMIGYQSPKVVSSGTR
jgi:hypothetical protein